MISRDSYCVAIVFEDKKKKQWCTFLTRFFKRLLMWWTKVFYFSCDPGLEKCRDFLFSPFSISQICNIINQCTCFFPHQHFLSLKKICAAGEGTQSNYQTGYRCCAVRARLTKAQGLANICLHQSHVFYVNWLSRRQMVSKLFFCAQKKHWICLHHCFIIVWGNPRTILVIQAFFLPGGKRQGLAPALFSI